MAVGAGFRPAKEQGDIDAFKAGIKSRKLRRINGIEVNDSTPDTLKSGAPKAPAKPAPWMPSLFKLGTDVDKKPDGETTVPNDPVSLNVL